MGLTEPDRPLRADAARNRARVLEVAYDTFAGRGAVGADRRDRPAGRRRRGHRLPALPDQGSAVRGRRRGPDPRASSTTARALLASDGPGEALFAFLRAMAADWGATDHGTGRRARRATGSTSTRRCPEPRRSSSACSATCWWPRSRRALCAPDVGVPDVKALLVGVQGDARTTATTRPTG